MVALTSKASSMAMLKELFPNLVPTFIVIRTEDLLTPKELIEYSLISDMETMITFLQNLSLSSIFPTIEKALVDNNIQKTDKLAIRTSAFGEDGENASFAGMFESFLAITNTQEAVSVALLDSWLSLFSQRVINYRTMVHSSESYHCEIIVQKLVSPSHSGVIFTDAENIGESLIGVQTGNGKVVSGENANTTSLTIFTQNYPAIGEKIHSVIMSLNAKYPGKYLDIEFGFIEETLWLFQVRPVTKKINNQFSHLIWDKSNIGENYPGTSLPLTYSFIRKAYSQVYPSFLSLIGIKTDQQDQQLIFDNLLGYIHGQVYYNLENWYEIVDLLPWQPAIRTFYDNMLQPVVPLPQTKILKQNKQENLRGAFSLAKMFLFPKKEIENPFERKFTSLASEFKKSIDNTSSILELQKLYVSLSSQFFSVWSYTIVNDVRTMIFFGLYTRLVTLWCSNSEEIVNQLVIAQRPASVSLLVSLESTAQCINRDTVLTTLLKKAEISEAKQYLSKNPTKESSITIASYLEKYGVRFANELKLETIPINTDIESFLLLMMSYLEKTWSIKNIETANVQFHIKSNWSWAKMALLHFVRRQTVRAISLREKFRLDRAQVFDMARTIFLKMGQLLKDSGLIKSQRDIFYLSLDEINESIYFHSSSFSLQKRIQDQKELLETYKSEDIPRRVDSYGIVQDNKLIGYTHYASGKQLKGLGTSPFIIERTEAVVMNEFDVTRDVRGKVLVVPHTDPGWTVLFPLIKGVITEEGNILSHASIIARELNIPCVTKIKNAAKIIKNGDKITVNGITGEVTLQ